MYFHNIQHKVPKAKDTRPQAKMQIEHRDLRRDQGHRMKPKPLPSSDQQHLWVIFHMSSMPTEQISGSHAAQLYYNMQNKIHDGPAT